MDLDDLQNKNADARNIVLPTVCYEAEPIASFDPDNCVGTSTSAKVYIVRASSLTEVDGARGHLNLETENKLVTGMISEIVSTADAIKNLPGLPPSQSFRNLGENAKRFENLGMAVGSNDHGYIS